MTPLVLCGGSSWVARKRRELCMEVWGAPSVAAVAPAVIVDDDYNGSIEPSYMSSVPSECDHVERLVATIEAGDGFQAYESIAHVIYPTTK